MAGAGGSVQPTSTFQTSSLEIDSEYDASDVLETVVIAGENLGYEFDKEETEDGFLAFYGNSPHTAVGTKNESLRVEYKEEDSELYVRGASRSNVPESLTSVVESELEQ